MKIRKLIILASLVIPTLGYSQATNLKIDGITKAVTFVDNGVDFNKTFVIIGDQFKPWENAFMLAGIQVGTYYYDAKEFQHYFGRLCR